MTRRHFLRTLAVGGLAWLAASLWSANASYALTVAAAVLAGTVAADLLRAEEPDSRDRARRA